MRTSPDIAHERLYRRMVALTADIAALRARVEAHRRRHWLRRLLRGDGSLARRLARLEREHARTSALLDRLGSPDA